MFIMLLQERQERLSSLKDEYEAKLKLLDEREQMVSDELEAVNKKEAELAKRQESLSARDVELISLSDSLKVSRLCVSERLYRRHKN